MPMDASATYFITTITWERRSLFQVHATAQLFVDTLQHYRKEGHYKLHAYVVMPDHVHLLLTPCGITIERAVGLIKGGFSRRLGASFPVWQKGFVDRRMRNAEEFLERKEYIHRNPLRGGLVTETEEYRFSSAFKGETSAAKAAL